MVFQQYLLFTLKELATTHGWLGVDHRASELWNFHGMFVKVWRSSQDIPLVSGLSD
jgi:hypothetical protein